MSVTITISEQSLPRIEYQNANGLKRGFFVHHDQLIGFLQSATNDRDIEDHGSPLMVTPALPPNCVKYAFLSNDSHALFVTAPEISVNVKYHATEFENVPFPKLVFAFIVRNEILTKAYVAVYKDLFLRDNTKLYHFPYSNVYTDGQLCYWSNEKFKDLVQLQTFHHRWVQEPNSDHLFRQSLTTLNKPLRELFDISQNKPFDYSILTPMEITFNQWSYQVISKQ